MALHAVAPNSLINCVFLDEHRGHKTTFDGEAIPNFCNFCFVFSDIQSVVQAGEYTNSILKLLIPFLTKHVLISSVNVLTAGHPEYVGVMHIL